MRIGITERGDAGLDLSWYQTLLTNNYDGAVLITKNANPSFQNKVFQLIQQGFSNIIIHFTCTGWGNTEMEPNVPSMETQLTYMQEMIHKGFPMNQCVLRIDPIIPTKEGLLRFHHVMQHPFVQLHPELRIRISILDRYPHVRNRINPILHTNFGADSFYPSKSEMEQVRNALDSYPDFTFETCAEPYLKSYQKPNHVQTIGCISQKDCNIFHLPIENNQPAGYQRKHCLCLSCKQELLKKPKRCPHQCAYCYWKD